MTISFMSLKVVWFRSDLLGNIFILAIQVILIMFEFFILYTLFKHNIAYCICQLGLRFYFITLQNVSPLEAQLLFMMLDRLHIKRNLKK